MAKTMKIHVARAKTPMARIVIQQTIFWTFLVGAVGLSRIWFGGAWVIDIVAVFLTFLCVFALGARHAGWEVELTKEQIAAWVAAGQPEDVKAWKERTYG